MDIDNQKVTIDRVQFPSHNRDHLEFRITDGAATRYLGVLCVTKKNEALLAKTFPDLGAVLEKAKVGSNAYLKGIPHLEPVDPRINREAPPKAAKKSVPKKKAPAKKKAPSVSAGKKQTAKRR